MGFREHDRKTFVADSARAVRQQRITKREFMRRMALTNVGSEVAAAQTPDDVKKWLKDVGGKFKGTTIRYTSEATPPTIVANQIAKDEFTALTGINVEIEIVPLEQVLEKATLDVQGQLGTYDVYYLDQSWTALFANDCVDPKEKYASNKELAMPGYDWDDFSKALTDGISTFDGRLMGVPFDIPIFIMMYRRDLYEKHGLKVPTTMAEYMETVKAINGAEKANG